MDNFSAMVESVKKACKNLYMEYKGQLLRPAAHLMRLKEKYEVHHGVRITDDALISAPVKIPLEKKIALRNNISCERGYFITMLVITIVIGGSKVISAIIKY